MDGAQGLNATDNSFLIARLDCRAACAVMANGSRPPFYPPPAPPPALNEHRCPCFRPPLKLIPLAAPNWRPQVSWRPRALAVQTAEHTPQPQRAHQPGGRRLRRVSNPACGRPPTQYIVHTERAPHTDPRAATHLRRDREARQHSPPPLPFSHPPGLTASFTQLTHNRLPSSPLSPRVSSGRKPLTACLPPVTRRRGLLKGFLGQGRYCATCAGAPWLVGAVAPRQKP